MLNSIKKYQMAMSLIFAVMILSCGWAQAQLAYPELFPSLTPVSPTGISSSGYKLMPPSFTFALAANDLDAVGDQPLRYRYLIKPAIDGSGNPIRTPYEFDLHFAEVLSLEDPLWSVWQDVPAAPENIEIPLVALPADEYFFVSVQVLDADGATRIPFEYQRSTFHFKILADFFRPEVALNEVFLGTAIGSISESEIASGQPLNFSWVASADAYAGEIVSYRHGWDLLDIDDPNDPGWEVPPGTAAQNLFAPERSFQEGLHVFTLRVEDNSGQLRVMTWTLRVVPYVSPEFQLPLLVLDQTIDRDSQAWPDAFGAPRDNEDYRNGWWQFLAAGSGGVADINWERDWRSDVEFVQYSDLVNYRVVLCYARSNQSQLMFQQFRPQGDNDKFVWLTPYQTLGGNFFLVGGSSMESFLEGLPNYMVPIIFDTAETELELSGQTYVTGFGTTVLPDGSEVLRGPRMYPYATAGIAALDWTSPSNKYIYGRSIVARFDRTSDCVGLKGLALTPEFRSFYLVPPDAIADTIWTDTGIDWRDNIDAMDGSIELFSLSFPFRRDEFVDGNVSPRSTPLVLQFCDDGPSGACIEPMFTGISRFDYVREFARSQGEVDWPFNRYTEPELDSGCGPLALTGYEGVPSSSARTNGRTYGYFSYKMVADKPAMKADVYWGFDPYRFDQNETKKAIRWVLDYFGLQINP
jgi:hypothetical protein